MLYILVAIIVGYFILKEAWMRWNYDLYKIPCPPSVPLLGHRLLFKRGKYPSAINLWMREWREKLGYPNLMRIDLVGRTSILVGDIRILRNLVLPKTGGPVKGGKMFVQFHRLLMGDDPTPYMFTTPQPNDPYVKAIRRAYFASLTSEGLRTLIPTELEIIKKMLAFVESKRKEGTVDVQELFTKMMLEMILKTGTDIEVEAMNDSSPLYNLIIACGHHMRALGTVPFVALKTKLFPNSTFAKQVRDDFAALHNECFKIAKEVDNRDDPEPDNIALWANLKRLRRPGTNDPLPLNLLKGELATVVIGGMDTTGHQLAWILALLATNPQVVEKLLDELKSHGLFGKEARDPDYEDLGKLEYLAAVVKEGIRRMHTMVFLTNRVAPKNMVLAGYRIPEGTTLFLGSGTTMNSENEWEDHLSFQPERWLNNGVNLAEKYYVPFGHGARDCVGQKLAIQVIRLTILLFVRQYSFELVGDSMDSLVNNGVAGFVFEARNGVNLKVTPRAL